MDGIGSVRPSIPSSVTSCLSHHWIETLERLCCRRGGLSAPFYTLPNLSERFRTPCDDEKNKMAYTWDEILTVFVRGEAVLRGGSLEIRPVFFSLPALVQTRFLYLLEINFHKISTVSIENFVTRLKRFVSSNFSWTSHGIRQLERLMELEKNSTCQFHSVQPPTYSFSSEVQTLISNFSMKLHREVTPTARNSDGISYENPVEAAAVPDGNRVLILNGDGNDGNDGINEQSNNSSRIVDVIVIDDDSCSPESETQDKNNRDVETQSTNDIDIFDVDDISPNDCLKKSIPCGKRVRSPLPGQEQKQETMNNVNNFEICDSVEPPAKITKRNKHSSQDDKKPANTASEKIYELEINENKTSHKTEVLSEEEMTHLRYLSETFHNLGDETALQSSISSDIFAVFSQLSAEKMENACSILKAFDLSERALVNVCDVIPWSQMAHDPACVFLRSCLKNKLEANADSSQCLVATLTSVAETNAIVVVDVLVQLCAETHSTDLLCQLLAAICKSTLTPNSLGTLLKKLCNSSAEFGEQMVPVLQVILDRRAEYEMDMMKDIIQLLIKGSQALCSDPKFGSLLMACLTKYGKKMTSGQLTAFSSLIDVHNSRFKGALKSVLKRFTSS